MSISYTDSIPLVKDIIDTYPDTNIDDHLNSKMLKMYENLTSTDDNNHIYTNEEIYEYIKFVNVTCMDIIHYKPIVKYISKDNILFFDSLFNNYDIFHEVFPLLSYDTVVNYYKFEVSEIKDRWIICNMTWIKRYKTELLDPYMKIEIDKNKYYVISDNIYSNRKKVSSIPRHILGALCDLPEISKRGHLDLVKYIINKIEKPLLKNLLKESYRFRSIIFLHEAVSRACENDHLEIVKYMINFFKSNNILHLTKNKNYTLASVWLQHSTKNVNIIKYLIEDEDLKEYINIHSDINVNGMIMLLTGYGNIQMVDFLLSLGGCINVKREIYNKHMVYIKMPQHEDIHEKVDLLTIATCNGDLEMVKYLINKGISLWDYAEKSIMLASKSNDNNTVVKYIIDKYINLVKDDIKDMENFINTLLVAGNKNIVAYVNDEYITINSIVYESEDIVRMISSAYIGGQIEFIMKIFNNGIINDVITSMTNTHISSKNIISVINYNSEHDCVKFLIFLKEKGIQFEIINEIIDICVEKGYIYLLLFILNGEYENIDVVKCILNSHSEDVCVFLINAVYENKKIEEEEAVKIIESSAKKGYINLIRLVNKDKLINLPLNDLLIEACSNNYFEIIKYLVELGADVNYRQSLVLNEYTGYNVITILMLNKHENIEIVKYIINNNLNIKDMIKSMYIDVSKYDKDMFSNIIKYVYDNNLENVNSIITQYLFNALCKHNRIDLVSYFLKKEVSPFNSEYGLATSLSINNILNDNIHFNRVEIVKLLLNDEKLQKVAIVHGKTFVYVCKSGYTEIVRMISKYVDLKEYGKKALTQTCKNENLEIVVHLIECGVDFQFDDNKLLRLCAKYGYIDIVRYLVEKGADINVINTKYYDVDIQQYLNEVKSSKKLIGEDNDCDTFEDYYSSDDIESV